MNIDVVAIIGAITGILSFLGMVYALGVKFGQFNTKIENIEEKLIDPVQFGGLCNQVETLYGVYVIDSLPRPSSRGQDLKMKKNPGKIIILPEEIEKTIREKTKEKTEQPIIDIVIDIALNLAAEESGVFVNFVKAEGTKNAILEIYKVVKKELERLSLKL